MNEGEQNPSSKLTESQVMEIRRSSETNSEAARRFQVSQATVCNIRNGKYWGHLPLIARPEPKPTCPMCNGPSRLSKYARTGACVCSGCVKAQRKAVSLLRYEVESGRIPRLPDGRKCVSCEREAVQWEHRDYDKPFEVEAVCALCNAKRGHAKRSFSEIPRQPYRRRNPSGPRGPNLTRSG